MASLILHSRCLIVPLLLALPASGLEDADFPVEAYVVRDRSAVRSGPGPQYYATDQLSRGTPVEIYRRDDGGWLAVRPPEGSYSLVAAKHLEMTSRKDVARVSDPQAVAWVGTRHGPVGNHKWQVRLEVGEWVRVLGEERVALFEGGKQEKAFRIAPPAGEFRWIHQEDVGRRPPPQLQEEQPAQAPQGRTQREEIAPLPDEEGVPAWDVTEYRLLVEGDVREDRAAPPAEALPAREPEEAEVWRAKVGKPVPVAGVGENRVEVTTRSTIPDTLRDAPDPLREVDLQLSLMVARPPQQWDLTPLRRVTLEMVDSGATALERGRARLLLEKITEFAELQNRHQQWESTGLAANSPQPNGAAPAAAAQRIGPVGTGIETPAKAAANYDARGVLVPVHSRTGRVPPYALVDGNGQVLKYVSPSPGLNLHRYLGKQVGILGQRGYLPSIEARHVTAHRVIQLDRHLR